MRQIIMQLVGLMIELGFFLAAGIVLAWGMLRLR
jgi:hypothetical protein